jgi:hypothetical protein
VSAKGRADGKESQLTLDLARLLQLLSQWDLKFLHSMGGVEAPFPSATAPFDSSSATEGSSVDLPLDIQGRVGFLLTLRNSD